MRIKQQQSRERETFQSLFPTLFGGEQQRPHFSVLRFQTWGSVYGPREFLAAPLSGGREGGWGGRKRSGGVISPAPQEARERKKGGLGRSRPSRPPREVAHGASTLCSSPPLQAALPGTGRRGSRAGSLGSARTRTPRPRAGPGVAAHVLLVVGATGSPPAPGARAAPPRPAGLGDRGVGGPGPGARPHPPR